MTNLQLLKMATKKTFRSTNLNDTVILNILKAIKNVQAGYGVDHVRNKKGNAFLAVRRSSNVDSSGKRLFEITDKNGNNIRAQLGNYILDRTTKEPVQAGKKIYINRPISNFILNHITW